MLDAWLWGQPSSCGAHEAAKKLWPGCGASPPAVVTASEAFCPAVVQAVLPDHDVDPVKVKTKAFCGSHSPGVNHSCKHNNAPPSERQSSHPGHDHSSLHTALTDKAANGMRVLASAKGEPACSAHQAFCCGLGQVSRQGLLLSLLLKQVMLLLLSTKPCWNGGPVEEPIKKVTPWPPACIQ